MGVLHIIVLYLVQYCEHCLLIIFGIGGQGLVDFVRLGGGVVEHKLSSISG